MHKNQNRAKAFTLIEIGVVVAIIALLLTIVGKAVVTIKTSRLSNARYLTNSSKISEFDGLVAWYETSYIQSLKPEETQDQDWISTWNDISPFSLVNDPNSNALTRTASANIVFEENGINDLPSIKFDGSTNANLTLSQLSPSGDLAQATIFIVLRKLNSLTSTRYLFDSTGSGSDFSFGIGADNVTFNAGNLVTTSNVINPASFKFNENVILVVYFNGSNSRAFVNDAKLVSGGSDIDSGTNSLTGLTIGTDRNGANGFKGLISEIIIFDRPISQYLRKDILNYLSNKYDIRVNNL